MAQFLDKAKNFVAEKMANIEKPEAEITDVDLKNVSREAVEYDAKVSVDNPYSHSLPILIASGTMADPGSLKGNDKTLLQVPMKVPPNILVSLAKDIGADWDIDYEVELGLTIDLPIIGNFTIPLSKKGEFKLPSLSDIF
ncbi:putative desiccation-related protein LEA14 [Citrus sinensis]|uniref:Desiccation-related protein LEA14 n=1 Tax=Citrus sinensis TaxID=2711 RepID=A0ACB8P0L5_CITSI|nr:putative desiccation-related protein LEA14 [Citrus sinensis]KAH9803619.1 putative desiccation-related protein LEA14 [Citrus sinensis]